MEVMTCMEKFLKQRKLVFITALDVLSRNEAISQINKVNNYFRYLLLHILHLQ